MSIQMTACADGAPLERPTDGLGWLLLIPLGCLVLGQVLLASSGTLPVLDGVLADPDSYMRLNRVVHLYESGNWFDSTYPRINPPDGHVQHWTRPLDALLLAGAWLLQPFLGFKTALHVWGVLFSPVCLALMVVVLNWASAPVLPRDARLIACLLLLLQPTVIGYSSLGRADHHALLFVLFLVLLGATARLLLAREDDKMPLAAGAATALAVWVSPEALVFIAASLAALSLSWLFGDRAIAGRCRSLLGWTTACLALALVVERGAGGLLVVENDRLSIVHVALFGSIAVFWATITPLESRFGLESRHRLLLAATGLAVVAGTMTGLFPRLIQGPLGTVDPLYNETRLQRITEIQPLIEPQLVSSGAYGALIGRIIMALGIAALAIPYLALRVVRSGAPARDFWIVIAIATLAFLPLAVHQIRWSGYAQILLVVPYAALVNDLLNRLARRMSAPWLHVARPAAIVVALFWPVAATAALPRPEMVTANDACSIAKLAPDLERLARARAVTILAYTDFGSELLYRTRHSVLAIPNHRPQPGFTATYQVLTTTEPETARAILARHGVRWILLCPGPVEKSSFLEADTASEPSFYQRLIEGRAPGWLRRLPLTAAAGATAMLYEVEPAAPAGPAGPETGR